ncbi:MAG: hypothetical protein SGPRY_005497, partial [Prymnesium sp.]
RHMLSKLQLKCGDCLMPLSTGFSTTNVAPARLAAVATSTDISTNPLCFARYALHLAGIGAHPSGSILDRSLGLPSSR